MYFQEERSHCDGKLISQAFSISLLFQDLKNQVMTTNIWLEQVKIIEGTFVHDFLKSNFSRNG